MPLQIGRLNHLLAENLRLPAHLRRIDVPALVRCAAREERIPLDKPSLLPGCRRVVDVHGDYFAEKVHRLYALLPLAHAR